jgi:hypothetical protein
VPTETKTLCYGLMFAPSFSISYNTSETVAEVGCLVKGRQLTALSLRWTRGKRVVIENLISSVHASMHCCRTGAIKPSTEGAVGLNYASRPYSKHGRSIPSMLRFDGLYANASKPQPARPKRLTQLAINLDSGAVGPVSGALPG